jgi:hypothetical protein
VLVLVLVLVRKINQSNLLRREKLERGSSRAGSWCGVFGGVGGDYSSGVLLN